MGSRRLPACAATASVAAVLTLSTAGGRVARADESTPPAAAPQAQPAASPAIDARLSCPTCFPGYWSDDPARPFVSLRLDTGYLYLKPRFSFGYGKPFSLWGGIDAVPLVTPDSAGGYGGLRVQIEWLELRAGARYVHAFVHQFLAPRDTYSLVDLAQDNGHPSEYLDLEAELAAAIPVGPGSVLVTGTASSIQRVPAGYYVYDETLRVVVSPPPVYRARLGYALPFMPENNARLGLVGEVLDIPDRNARVYRGGVVATFDVDDHLQAIATVIVPLWSPDSLGFLGADYTELGIRYRWATGKVHVPHEPIPPSGDTASGQWCSCPSCTESSQRASCQPTQ
jgi:hypothetical protein